MRNLCQIYVKWLPSLCHAIWQRLSEDEARFYDALANNESAVWEMSDEILKKIAHAGAAAGAGFEEALERIGHAALV